MQFCSNGIKSILRLSKTNAVCLKKNFTVAVLGASGDIGQPLSLLLKKNSLVTKLVMYDLAQINFGVSMDVSHINTPTKVHTYCSQNALKHALCGCHVIVILAGLTQKLGMSRDVFLKTNAEIVYSISSVIAKSAPSALICVVTNPVNTTVPIVAEVMKKHGVHDPARIFGVTTLDLVRASAFVSEILRCEDPSYQYVPVVGGHAGATIIPLLSLSCPSICACNVDIQTLTKRIQEAGTEVMKAKVGGGSATLSMAFAAKRFINSVLRGLTGENNIVEIAYVKSNVTKAEYFATPVVLGPCGVALNLGIPCGISCYEKNLIENAVTILQKNIQFGVDFVKNHKKNENTIFYW